MENSNLILAGLRYLQKGMDNGEARYLRVCMRILA